MVVSIAWFITSIETTIRWNNIQGVHTIDSTGQLIPFIIGCVSASQVLKKVILLALGKVGFIFFSRGSSGRTHLTLYTRADMTDRQKYPDWVDTDLEILNDIDGPRIWEIVKRSDSNANSTGGLGAGTTTV